MNRNCRTFGMDCEHQMIQVMLVSVEEPVFTRFCTIFGDEHEEIWTNYVLTCTTISLMSYNDDDYIANFHKVTSEE